MEYASHVGVLQVLALDIGTDLLPAIALGVEPSNARTLTGRARVEQFIDRRLMTRVFGFLGPAEAAAALGAFAVVLAVGGWRCDETPSSERHARLRVPHSRPSCWRSSPTLSPAAARPGPYWR